MFPIYSPFVYSEDCNESDASSHRSLPLSPKSNLVNHTSAQGIDEQDVDRGSEKHDGPITESGGDSNEESENESSCLGEPAMDFGPLPEDFGSLHTFASGESIESISPDTWIRDQFRAYCNEADGFRPFTKDERRSIRLMHALKEKNTSMNAYESISLWHFRESNKLYQHQTLRDCKHYIGRKTMLQRLIKRYNFEDKMPFQKTIKLPVSGTIVRLTCHDAKATIQRLLTDPRIKAQDYLFWDGNPLQSPPENLDYIKDLNTGRAFLDTYARLISPGAREQLLPIVIYFDGTAVSHFHDMEIIQVNIALGTMTRSARSKSHCWAPLGYIEKIHEQGGRGREILAKANHMETQDAMDPNAGDENVRICHGIGDKSDQDFHAMMSCILEDFISLQETGFIWDHHNPGTGEDTNDIHFKLFVPYLRVDGKEGDIACAKYGQRYSAQQICRQCHVPLQEADNHMAKYPLKTVTEIKKLIDAKDYGGLQQISQTYLQNAFYDVRFSMGNDYGIHGACPTEMLHAFLLGTFKYIRDIFFEMVGDSSDRAKSINALSQVYGGMFAHQSDRTMPNTAFGKGIHKPGKLMAKDYRGALLIILVIVRCTKGRKILKTSRKFRDKEETALDDWILLVELMLEWEAYLNEPVMYLKHVKRLEKKHRYIMYIMRKVAQRNKGMGLKLQKFHSILHICENIIELGVPLEYDTSANESMHKPSKQASKMTQKSFDSFNSQTAQRLVEFFLIDLAMEEIDHERRVWDYFQRKEGPEQEGNVPESSQICTGEARIEVYYDDETGDIQFEMVSRSKFAWKTTWDRNLIDFLLALQERIREEKPIENIAISTLHRRHGQIFRGHPNFRGKGPWKDWVWVDWGPGYGRMPCHIWCFVQLQGMPTGRSSIHYGGIELKDGVFAVVETATLDEDSNEVGKADLLTPFFKEVTLDANGNVQKRTFYLADTEAFVAPCCVIPDIGGPTNRYFVVKPRNAWKDEFIRWVQDEHALDEMDDLDAMDEDDETMEEERPNRKRKTA